jgi:hypothetical protein
MTSAAPRPPGVGNLLGALADAMPPCCPANWADDIREHADDCPEWELDRIRERRRNRQEKTK